MATNKRLFYGQQLQAPSLFSFSKTQQSDKVAILKVYGGILIVQPLWQEVILSV
jgi:hypothetical protein